MCGEEGVVVDIGNEVKTTVSCEGVGVCGGRRECSGHCHGNEVRPQ